MEKLDCHNGLINYKKKNLKEGQKASWIFFSGQESLVFQSLDKYNIYGFNIRKFRKGVQLFKVFTFHGTINT